MTLDRKPGRPVTPLPSAVCDRLLEWLAEGRTLRAFARAEGVSEATLYRWTEKDEGFRRDVRAARLAGCESLAAEILDIADGSNPESVAVDRLRIDARRWLLSRWSPERYGDAKEAGDIRPTVMVVTGVPRNAVERKSDPTGGRPPLAAPRARGEEHNISNTNIPNSPKPRVTVEIDPPSPDTPL